MKKILLTLSPFALIALLIYVYSNTGRASGSSKRTFEKFYDNVETISQNSTDSDISGEFLEENEEDNKIEEPELNEPITINPDTMQPSGIDTNPESITVLVNKQYTLETTYEPEDLVIPNIKFSSKRYDPKMQLRQVAATAMENLFQAALEDGIELIGVSGYRSYNRQLEIYANNLIHRGITFTNQYSAMAGSSEHQTGLAMDISTSSIHYKLCDQFADTKEGQWVQNHCYEYGFIVRYPADKTHVTGYAYEPWHIRYVGVELATYLNDNNLTLDEYYGYEYDESLYAEVDYDAIIDQYYEMKGIRRKQTLITKGDNSPSIPLDDFSEMEDPDDRLELPSEEEGSVTPSDSPEEPTDATTQKPTKTPSGATTPTPTKTPEDTVTLKPTKVPEPTATSKPTKVPEPTETPTPTEVPEDTATPTPTNIPEPTITPEETPTPIPTTTPVDIATPEPSESATASDTPNVSEEPEPSEPTLFSDEVSSDDVMPTEPTLEP